MSDATAHTKGPPEIDVEAAEHLKRSLANAQRRNQRILLRLLEGVDHQASLVRLLDDGGHINWLLGHLATSRDDMLQLLGAARLMADDTDARYGYGSKPDSAEDAAPLESLLAALERSHQRVLEEIGALDAARLMAAAERGRRLLE
ncbi:MAG TPA: DinB family protein, partial [Trueperaceae bacterium]|nr:DinB family protein [Trueperaceae bacterium]